MTPGPVTIVEVGPRDGLQNEAKPVPAEAKLAFIAKLVSAGLRHIEVTSFVHPKAVPQLADAEAVLRGLPAATNVTYSALVPNMRGLDRALDADVTRIAVFTAASERFTEKNIGMTIAESLAVFTEVVDKAKRANVTARAYLSTAFVCPYQGEIPAESVRDLTKQLLDIGADEVAISDTIGAAAPSDVTRTVGLVLQDVPAERIALHFHDTYGTALANVYAGLQIGVRTFDASAGGLGGCPFAPGAAGNLATEDLVYMLERMGMETGVELDRVVDAADELTRTHLGRTPASRQWQRLRGAKR